jgi:hypothetical protein
LLENRVFLKGDNSRAVATHREPGFIPSGTLLERETFGEDVYV